VTDGSKPPSAAAAAAAAGTATSGLIPSTRTAEHAAASNTLDTNS
jgi:hypothetical protein